MIEDSLPNELVPSTDAEQVELLATQAASGFSDNNDENDDDVE